MLLSFIEYISCIAYNFLNVRKPLLADQSKMVWERGTECHVFDSSISNWDENEPDYHEQTHRCVKTSFNSNILGRWGMYNCQHELGRNVVCEFKSSKYNE